MLLLFLPLEVHFTFESYIYKSGNHITPSNGVIMAVIPVTCCSLKGTLSWKKMQLFTCGSFYFLYHKKSLFVLLLIDNDPTVLFDHCTSDKGPGHYRQQIHSTVRIRCLIILMSEKTASLLPIPTFQLLSFLAYPQPWDYWCPIWLITPGSENGHMSVSTTWPLQTTLG